MSSVWLLNEVTFPIVETDRWNKVLKLIFNLYSHIFLFVCHCSIQLLKIYVSPDG